MEQIYEISSDNIKQMRKGLTWTGILTVCLGIAAILLPFIATLTIQAIIAIVFMIAGITHIVHAFHVRRMKGMLFRFLGGALYTGVGIMLVLFPLEGALSLTILLAALFLVLGAFKIALSLHIRPDFSWGWMMISGFISIFLGLIIWTALPEAAKWAIGLIVGIELIFSGLSMLTFAQSLGGGVSFEEK